MVLRAPKDFVIGDSIKDSDADGVVTNVEAVGISETLVEFADGQAFIMDSEYPYEMEERSNAGDQSGS